MTTTQRSVTLTLTERAGEEVKKFLAEEKVSQEIGGTARRRSAGRMLGLPL